MNRERRKAAGHTGVMLALFVPASAIERVMALQRRLPSPEPPEDLHLTLAYLGNSDRLIEQRPYLERTLRDVDWVAAGLPLSGTIGGIGRFHHDEGNGTNAVYASFDAPGLPMFRQRIIEQLKMNGILPAENHGFTPHITLAYVPIEQDVRTLAPAELPEIVFGALTLAWRDERIEFGPGARMKEATVGGITAPAGDGSRRRRRAAAQSETKQGMIKRSSLTVTKDATGRWRWLTFSSTAFRDRDDEIVSTKALSDDVARADADGDYGPLRWWHIPGMDIGDCDFNAMHGRTLIESGTFRDERYGPLIAAKAADLGVSIGYRHSVTEPDADRVFHRIRRFERSLMPNAYPSNLYTALVVKETPTVDAVKIAKLKEIGFDDATIAVIQEQAQAREKAAETAGITFKEAETPVVATPVEVPAVEAPSTPAEVFVGDLSPDAFVALQQQANQPLLDALGLLNAMTATKAAKEGETQVALKSTQDALAQLQTTLKADREAVDTKLQAALTSIKELQGDVPAGIRRASQDPANIASEQQVEAFKGPAADPMNDFFSFVQAGAAG